MYSSKSKNDEVFGEINTFKSTKYLEMYFSTVTEYLYFNTCHLSKHHNQKRSVRIFPLFLFVHWSRWLAVVCPGDFLQSMTLQNNYVDLKGAATVPVSKIRWVAKVQTVIFLGGDQPVMSSGCSTLEGACWSSRQANVIVSFRGILSTSFLILLLFSLHLCPPRGCISTISLSSIGNSSPNPTLSHFPMEFSGPGAFCT